MCLYIKLPGSLIKLLLLRLPSSELNVFVVAGVLALFCVSIVSFCSSTKNNNKTLSLFISDVAEILLPHIMEMEFWICCIFIFLKA